MIRVFFGVPESYGNTYWALLGHTGKKEKGLKGGRTPPLGLVRIGLGGGAAPPPSFSSLSPFLDSYSYYLEGGGILLPVGVGLLLGRAIERAGPPLLHSFIYEEGAPLGDRTIDH